MLQNGTLIGPLPKDGSVKLLSRQRVKAEILYNSIPTTKILFIVCFVCALISFTLTAYKSIRNLKPNVLDQKFSPPCCFSPLPRWASPSRCDGTLQTTFP